VTKEGVDWLISRTDGLETYLDRVNTDVLESVDVDAAIAIDDVAEGRTVGLVMREGLLHANPAGGTATAVTVTSAARGEAVGVAEFDGVLEYDTGTVTVVPVPTVTETGSPGPEVVTRHHGESDLLAVAGAEAYALASRAGVDPDVQFATADAVTEAAVRGLDVLLVVVTEQLPRHTATLREKNVPHEVLDAAEY